MLRIQIFYQFWWKQLDLVKAIAGNRTAVILSRYGKYNKCFSHIIVRM